MGLMASMVQTHSHSMQRYTQTSKLDMVLLALLVQRLMHSTHSMALLGLLTSLIQFLPHSMQGMGPPQKLHRTALLVMLVRQIHSSPLSAHSVMHF